MRSFSSETGWCRFRYSKRGAECVEEAPVLLAGSVGDPEVARIAEPLAATDHDPRLAELANHLALVAVAQRDPGEVGLGGGWLEPELVQALLDEDPLDDRPLDPLEHVILVEDGLGRGDLRQ